MIGVSDEVRLQSARLARLRNEIMDATNLPSSAFTMLVPAGWADSPSQVYGMWVRQSAAVTKAELAIDPDMMP